MSLRQHLTQELEHLDDKQLDKLAEYVAFLKFQVRHQTPVLDEAHLATLYLEFADEDRELAEEGIADYLTGLVVEDER